MLSKQTSLQTIGSCRLQDPGDYRILQICRLSDAKNFRDLVKLAAAKLIEDRRQGEYSRKQLSFKGLADGVAGELAKRSDSPSQQDLEVTKDTSLGVMQRRVKVLIALLSPFVDRIWQKIRHFVLDEPTLGGVAKDLVKFAILRLSLHVDDFQINIKRIGLTDTSLTAVASVLHSVRVQLTDGFLIYGDLEAGRADDLIHVGNNPDIATVVIDVASSTERVDKVDATDRAIVLIFWESTEEVRGAAMLSWMDQVEAYVKNNTVRAVILVGLQHEGQLFNAIDVLEIPWCVEVGH